MPRINSAPRPTQHTVYGHPSVGIGANGDTAAAREENGEFCVAVAPATRTAGILTMHAVC